MDISNQPWKFLCISEPALRFHDYYKYIPTSLRHWERCKKRWIHLYFRYFVLATFIFTEISFGCNNVRHAVFWFLDTGTSRVLNRTLGTSLKYGFCNKSFRKDKPLTSWTLLQHTYLSSLLAWLLLYLFSNQTKSEDKYVVKVFNWSEVHLS